MNRSVSLNVISGRGPDPNGVPPIPRSPDTRRQVRKSLKLLMKVENAVKVEPVGEFELKGIRRPLAAYNVLAAVN
jgi:hypothetical protein